MGFERFHAGDAALLLIDHQVGTLSQVGSMPVEEVKRNTIMLARVAKVLGLPVVLTTSMEDHAQGPLIPELQAILPEAFAARVKRAGVINAMEDPAFAEAVRATGRRRLILAGVTNDVCTVFPALTLVGQGLEVQVVTDAGGSPTSAGDEMALRRMEVNGVTLTGTNQIVAELTGSWMSPQGQGVLEVVKELALGR